MSKRHLGLRRALAGLVLLCAGALGLASAAHAQTATPAITIEADHDSLPLAHTNPSGKLTFTLTRRGEADDALTVPSAPSGNRRPMEEHPSWHGIH